VYSSESEAVSEAMATSGKPSDPPSPEGPETQALTIWALACLVFPTSGSSSSTSKPPETRFVWVSDVPAAIFTSIQEVRGE